MEESLKRDKESGKPVAPDMMLQNACAKRDIIILPLLAALGVLMGVGTGVASLAYGTTQIQQLANTLNTELQNVAALQPP